MAEHIELVYNEGRQSFLTLEKDSFLAHLKISLEKDRAFISWFDEEKGADCSQLAFTF